MTPSGPRFFRFACGFEAALIVVAAVLASLLNTPLFADLHWDTTDLLIGFIASVPLYLLFYWMLGASSTPLVRIRRILQLKLKPLFASWTLPQLALLSLLAGIGEELLFRSVVQGALASATGPLTALVLASVLFGLAHLITVGYAVIAAAIGLYLGALWLWSDNLLTPIVTHATYDFVALTHFLRRRDGHSSDPGGDAD